MSSFKRYSGVLVKFENKVLLCKRNSKGTLPGEWSIPAGKIEKGEHPLETAYREFFEETNVRINEPLNLIGFLNRTNRDRSKETGLLYLFLLEVNKELIPDFKNAKDGEEHTEYGYFTLEDLPITNTSDRLYKIIQRILE